MSLPWLDPENVGFPSPELALTEPDGLLAAGGALTPQWLTEAYRQGIFPWYETGQPILWWSPDPRLVLFPEQLKISRSLRKLIKKTPYLLTLDQNFDEVVQCCAESRRGATGTWITEEMQAAYSQLHQLGLAHSVEVWSGSQLVGGLYGVAIGKVFFGESMFSKEANTSKLALVYLVQQLQSWGFELIDCQVTSEHLLSLGAEEIDRRQFMKLIHSLTVQDSVSGHWQFDSELVDSKHEH